MLEWRHRKVVITLSYLCCQGIAGQWDDGLNQWRVQHETMWEKLEWNGTECNEAKHNKAKQIKQCKPEGNKTKSKSKRTKKRKCYKNTKTDWFKMHEQRPLCMFEQIVITTQTDSTFCISEDQSWFRWKENAIRELNRNQWVEEKYEQPL